MNNKIIFNQIKKQNFYTAYTTKGGILLKSYNTICGYVAPNGTLYRVRYTHTTGKQITQYAHALGIPTTDQHYKSADQLYFIIKSFENLDIPCGYGEAYGI